MRWQLATIAAAMLGIAAAPPATIEEFSGRVVSLSDGDTVTVLKDRKQTKVRLEGIDAPEKSQAFGNKSKDALADLIGRKEVTIHATGTDKYGRTLARVIFDGQDVSEFMVARGMAWHYKEYSDDESLAELEDKARASKIGLWAEPNALPPWEFRKRRKLDAAPPQASDSRGETTDPRQAFSAPQPQAGGHWLNTSSNTRHNASCQYFKNTKRGRVCGPNEGKACGTCGG
jgi:micrococcal nuclease